MGDEVSAFGGRKGFQCFGNRPNQFVERSGRMLPKKRLGFEKAISIGSGRGCTAASDQFRSEFFDRFPHSRGPMARQISADCKIARAKLRAENSLDADEEGVSVHGAVEQPGSEESVETKRGNERARLPSRRVDRISRRGRIAEPFSQSTPFHP